jgi:NADH-quinone oxidoreductase subunit A
MLQDYAGFFIFFAMMAGTGALMIVVSHLAAIKVKSDKYDWTRPYECGLRTEGLRLDRYPVHYYLVGILFVIFDVETVFFVPWAVAGTSFREADFASFWLVEMLIFMAILIVGYIYLVQRGVFNWGSKRPNMVAAEVPESDRPAA